MASSGFHHTARCRRVILVFITVIFSVSTIVLQRNEGKKFVTRSSLADDVAFYMPTTLQNQTTTAVVATYVDSLLEAMAEFQNQTAYSAAAYIDSGLDAIAAQYQTSSTSSSTTTIASPTSTSTTISSTTTSSTTTKTSTTATTSTSSTTTTSTSFRLAWKQGGVCENPVSSGECEQYGKNIGKPMGGWNEFWGPNGNKRPKGCFLDDRYQSHVFYNEGGNDYQGHQKEWHFIALCPVSEEKIEDIDVGFCTKSSVSATADKDDNNGNIDNEIPNKVPVIDYDYEFPRYHEDYRQKYPLPAWMEEFLAGQPTGDPEQHHAMLTDPNNKFLVMGCYAFNEGRKDEACGGLADRLHKLSYNIWVAWKMGYKLLIKYHKPRPLEEFLVPPPPSDGGFNWVLPDGYFEEELRQWGCRTETQAGAGRRTDAMVLVTKYPDQRVLFFNNNLQRKNYAHDWNTTVDELWPGVFRRFFQPSRETARRLQLLPQGLEPGRYAAAHMRAHYPQPFPGPKSMVYKGLRQWTSADKSVNASIDLSIQWNVDILSEFADHAVECAVRMLPDTEYVYVASDAYETISYLKQNSSYWADVVNDNDQTSLSWVGLEANNPNGTSIERVGQGVHGWGVDPWEIPTTATIVARHDYRDPSTHFDARRFRNWEPSLYGTFVDLWTIAHAGGHSMGLGGFGRFGAVLAHGAVSPTRLAQHRDRFRYSPSCATGAEREAWLEGHPYHACHGKTKEKDQWRC